MYKIFFDERIIYLTTQFEKYYTNCYGLFIKYLNEIQLAYVMELFRSVKEIKNVFIIHHDLEKIFSEFSSFFSIVEAAGGLVYNEEGKILVIHRRGKWDLPKGKMEVGENPEKCALREVEEECAVNPLRIRDLIHISYHSYYIDGVMMLKKTYWYKMTHEGNNQLSPQTEEDIAEAKWVDPSDLKEITDNTYGSILDVLKAGELI
mgnify:CR=1 FL=1